MRTNIDHETARDRFRLDKANEKLDFVEVGNGLTRERQVGRPMYLRAVDSQRPSEQSHP
jgi:hypothetical protein